MNILITGADGQLGRCILTVYRNAYYQNSKNNYHFVGRESVDITNKDSIEKWVKDYNIDIIVNCAAYTNVEKAEDDKDTAMAINFHAVKNLVDVCKNHDVFLIHISTDFVFDGQTNKPYSTISECKPLNVYGLSKYFGENSVLEYDKGMVIRTSWLYSEFGNNFYRTMLNRIINKQKTRVVCDQVGSPTYARDLAEFIIFLIEEQDEEDIEAHTGLYHFTNNGCCSWYDFAAAIEFLWQEGVKKDVYIEPCRASEYPCKAQRPYYSVLTKYELLEFPYEPRHWLTALKECMMNDYEIQEV
jgi:dTDP-4-dehydrorhamnose reductase